MILLPPQLITSAGVTRFGSEKSPPKAPYYFPGGFVLAISNANKLAQYTVFMDTVVGNYNSGNCTAGYIVPLTYDRKKNKLSDFKSRTQTWLAGTDVSYLLFLFYTRHLLVLQTTCTACRHLLRLSCFCT